MVDYAKAFIGGQRIDPLGSRVCEVHSPHDGTRIGSAPLATKGDIDLAVNFARHAFEHRRGNKTALTERVMVIERFRTLYAAETPKIAELVTRENGVPLRSNQALQECLLEQILAYLESARQFEWSRRPAQPGGSDTIVNNQPAGVVAAFIPWNAPQFYAIAWLVPAILTGCSVILALRPETALDVQVIGELLAEAGIMDGSVSILVTDQETGEYLATHPGVDKLAFSGSMSSGRRMAAMAASHLKRLTLNLLSMSPAIVLPDADLALTVEGLKHGSFFGTGEWSANQTRLLTPRRRHAEFVDAFAQMAEELPIGDPLNQSTAIGPLISQARKDSFMACVQLGLEDGAVLSSGGTESASTDLQGNYVRPTIFSDVSRQMRLFHQETPGPLVTITPYSDLDEAIGIANDRHFGTAASIWTADEELGVAIAGQMQVASATINGTPSTPGTPFGSFNESGMGRMFGSDGIREFVEVQSISY